MSVRPQDLLESDWTVGKTHFEAAQFTAAEPWQPNTLHMEQAGAISGITYPNVAATIHLPRSSGQPWFGFAPSACNSIYPELEYGALMTACPDDCERPPCMQHYIQSPPHFSPFPAPRTPTHLLVPSYNADINDQPDRASCPSWTLEETLNSPPVVLFDKNIHELAAGETTVLNEPQVTYRFEACSPLHQRPSQDPRSRRPRSSVAPWHKLRPIIERLYQVVTLEELRDCMSACGFEAKDQDYKYRFRQWGLKKTASSRRYQKCPNRDASTVSKRLPIQMSLPETYQARAIVLENSLYYINQAFRRSDKSQEETWSWDAFRLRPPSNSKGSLEDWTSIFDRCRTASMLLQVRGGNQKKWEHRATNPCNQKIQSIRQFFYALHEISDKLLKVSRDPNPTSLPHFWAVCSELRGICLRMKSTGSSHQVANHIRIAKRRGATIETLEEMRKKAHAKKTATTHALTLTKFLHIMWAAVQEHGSTHPWALILKTLCHMPSDELDNTICLAHEHTTRTFEAILEPKHPFVLHSWSRFLSCWDKGQLQSASLLQSYEHTFSQCTASAGLSHELCLSFLYEYAFASWHHSMDQNFQLDIAQRLLQVSYEMAPATGSIQYNTVLRAIYLATTMIGAHWLRKQCRNSDPNLQKLNQIREQAIDWLRRAVELLKQGDTDCRARAVELSGLLAGLYRRCNKHVAGAAEAARLIAIRSSLPCMSMPATV
ncbi:hypothetical protein BKA66DRAFT_574844 [Pyrenochaeta sp. MPI-SDFR-AT-0127]|nr:hypothetical protein BKA66DRAFT_574844 [Pyrenochaeta sp. MPI-SDFR-AT-0127]